MKRSVSTVLGILVLLGLAVGASMLLSSDANDGPVADRAPLADYHPSSPSVIASTGRPQLLEFFHPQ